MILKYNSQLIKIYRNIYKYTFRSRVSVSVIIELYILWSDVFLNISSILFLSHHQFTKVMILNNTLFLYGADVCELYVCIFWNVFIQKISPISVCMEVRVIYWVFLIIPLLLIISSISIWETVFLNWSRSLLF